MKIGKDNNYNDQNKANKYNFPTSFLMYSQNESFLTTDIKRKIMETFKLISKNNFLNLKRKRQIR